MQKRLSAKERSGDSGKFVEERLTLDKKFLWAK